MTSKGRTVVKTYVPKEMKPYLDFLCEHTGLSESEILRTALLEYYYKFVTILSIAKRP